MTKYIQTNEAGYVVSLTDEPLLAGLFGGSSKNFQLVEDQEAEVIQTVLDEKHLTGEWLHISALETKTE